jgi:hypothetical protein
MPGKIGLLDFAPNYETVKIGTDQELQVYGWTVFDFFYIMKRWPQLQRMFTKEGLTIQQAIDIAPESIAALIAIACGNVGNEQAEFLASRLPVGQQLAVLTASAKLTFDQEGFGPFVQQMRALGLNIDQAGKPPPTNSSSPSTTALQPDTDPNPNSGK